MCRRDVAQAIFFNRLYDPDMSTVLRFLALRTGIHRRRWLMLGGLLGLVGVIGTAPVAAQEINQTCREAIAAADSSYVNGDFEAAVDQVSICLAQQDIPEDQAVRAYRLLSLAYLQQDALQQARTAIVCSQVDGRDRPSKLSQDSRARMKVSWTRSSAFAGLSHSRRPSE